MSQHRFFRGALALGAAALFAGHALAQGVPGGATPGDLPSTTPGHMPPDTTMPAEPAQRVDPSGSDTMGDTAGGAPKSSSATRHGKKKKKIQTPKPADNDNNATPNTVSPQTPPR